MDENAATTDNLPVVTLLAIASDDTWLHVYTDVKSLFDDHEVDTKSHRQGPMEFFSDDGRRLAPVFGPTWQLEDLRETPDPPNPSLIQRRLYTVVRHAEGHLRRHPDLLEPFKLTLEDALARLPRLSTPSLAEDLALLRYVIGPHPLGHASGWFHNVLHAGGWTH